MMISTRTFFCLILATLMAMTVSADEATVTRRRTQRRRFLRRGWQEMKRIWGRNLAGECHNQQDNCFNLSGCMLCKSYTSNSGNGAGHVQCVDVTGNEDFLAGDNTSVCCAEEEGGQNGLGKTCVFFTPEEIVNA